MQRNERVRAVQRLLYRKDPQNAGTQWEDCNMVKRATPFTRITVGDADFKGGVKKSQHWMYPGGVIQRHPELVINGTEYFDPKELPEKKPRRKHESNLFVTLNTNKTPRNYPAAAQRAYRAMEETLQELAKEENICNFIMFGPKDSTFAGDKYEDVIASVEWKAGVETGEVLERLHCHVWLTVNHYSQIQINRQILAHMFAQMYNARAPQEMHVRGRAYCAVKLLPQTNFTQIMKDYIHKGMTS